MTDRPAPREVTASLQAAAFGAVDRHVASMVARRSGTDDPSLAVAIALAVKAVRLEHVCVELDAAGVAALWVDDGAPVDAPPDPATLWRALQAAPEVVECVAEGAEVADDGGRPFVVCGTRLYLRRHALDEQLVAARLRARDELAPVAALDGAVEGPNGRFDDSQVAAVRASLATPVSVIAGGPGTGKTTTIALLVRTVLADGTGRTVALAAPTGKAAARLNEAIAAALPVALAASAPRATTLHRLVGAGRGGRALSRRPLPYDVIVVDEASMVSLPMLATTLRRARPGARVVLVGDPDQLASIEVGAVLADIVEAAAAHDAGVVVTTLAVAHRFDDAGGVAVLADAVRSGDAMAVLADGSHDGLSHVAPDAARDAVVARVLAHATAVVDAARAGDAERALSLVAAMGVLCATRRGDGSTQWWNAVVEAGLIDRGVLGARDGDYLGRPVMVTRNDPLTGLSNGDIGVIVADGADGADRTARVCAFDTGRFALESLPSIETVWALTIHKSQGSEYDEVVVSLPRGDSPILSRELVYTAVTRARRAVTVIAPDGSLQAALARRVVRSSGLAARLRAPSANGTQRAADSSTVPAT